MAFWSNPTTEPKRQYRFLITNGSQDSVWYWVKNAQTPSFDINDGVYLLGNHKFKYPGTVNWNDVQISIVDDSNRIKDLYDTLVSGGYYPDASQTDGVNKIDLSKNFTNGADFQIVLLKADGTPSDTWTLENPWIKSANFGQLDYSSDELLTIDLTISYDRAEIT